MNSNTATVLVYMFGWGAVAACVFGISQCTMADSSNRYRVKEYTIKACVDAGFAWETSWDGWCDRSKPIPRS